MADERLSYLDSLRAIAIISVIAAHSAQMVGDIQRGSGSDIDGSLLSFFNQGGYGVQVFFFLSGYLLAMLYGFSNQDVRVNRTTKSFWIRRIFRIVPLWIAFFGVVALRPLFFPDNPGGWGQVQILHQEHPELNTTLLVLLSLTFLMWLVPQAWGGFIPGGWSIQAEMLHYLFFSIVRRWKIEAILAAWLVLAVPTIFIDKLLIRVNLDLGIIEGWRSQNLASTLLFFLAGCITYLVLQHYRTAGLTTGGKALSIISLSVVLLLPLNNIKSGQAFSAFGFVIYAVLLAYIIERAKVSPRMVGRIAKYSYFSYFFHFFALDLLEALYLGEIAEPLPLGQVGVGVGTLLVIVLVTTVSTLVGALSWRVFEKPMISLGDKISRPKAA